MKPASKASRRRAFIARKIVFLLFDGAQHFCVQSSKSRQNWSDAGDFETVRYVLNKYKV